MYDPDEAQAMYASAQASSAARDAMAEIEAAREQARRELMPPSVTLDDVATLLQLVEHASTYSWQGDAIARVSEAATVARRLGYGDLNVVPRPASAEER